MSSFSNFDLAQHLSNFHPCEPSLCIPKVFKNITWSQIYENVSALQLGDIRDIVMTPHADGVSKGIKVSITLEWNYKENSCYARNEILSGRDFKILYHKNWFWKVVMLKAKPVPPPKPFVLPKPVILFNVGREPEPVRKSGQDQFGRDPVPVPRVNVPYFEGNNKRTDCRAHIQRECKHVPVERQLHRHKISPVPVSPPQKKEEEEEEEEEPECHTYKFDADKPTQIAGFKLDYGLVPVPPKRKLIRRPNV